MKTRVFLFLAFIVLLLSGCVKYSDYWDLTPQAFFRALGGPGQSPQETAAREAAESRRRQFEADTTAYNQLTQAYRNGALTKEEYLRKAEPLIERVSINHGTAEGRELLAFWRLQAARWLEGKITYEEFSYSLVAKNNELGARVASQQLQQLQALQAAGMLQPQYQPNVLERAGQALQQSQLPPSFTIIDPKGRITTCHYVTPTTVSCF